MGYLRLTDLRLILVEMDIIQCLHPLIVLENLKTYVSAGTRTRAL